MSTVFKINVLYVRACMHIYTRAFIQLRLYSPLLDLDRFFSFLISYTVGRSPWTGDQYVARLLPAYGIAQTQNKRTEKSMPRVGFEPMTPVFEWAGSRPL
jgi:hypothetical protein